MFVIPYNLNVINHSFFSFTYLSVINKEEEEEERILLWRLLDLESLDVIQMYDLCHVLHPNSELFQQQNIISSTNIYGISYRKTHISWKSKKFYRIQFWGSIWKVSISNVRIMCLKFRNKCETDSTIKESTVSWKMRKFQMFYEKESLKSEMNFLFVLAKYAICSCCGKWIIFWNFLKIQTLFIIYIRKIN